jgi:hypothetical protein
MAYQLRGRLSVALVIVCFLEDPTADCALLLHFCGCMVSLYAPGRVGALIRPLPFFRDVV